MSNLSFVRGTGDGTNRQFLLSNAGTNIGYFRTSDIHAYVDDVEVTFTINAASPHIVVLDTAPKLGADVLLRREMPETQPYANFERGNNFGHRQVNNTFLQQLYLHQQSLDGFVSDGFYQKQSINWGGHKVTNLGDPEDAGDAANLAYVKAIDDANRADDKIKHDQLEAEHVILSQGIQDVNTTQSARNNDQDARLNALETAVPVEPSFTANWQRVATGGETVFDTNMNFGYAMVSINGVLQALGTSFNVLGSTIVFAEPLEEDDLVFAILSLPFTQRVPLEGTSDWFYTAAGSETQVDMGTVATPTFLVINGVVQLPSKAYSVAGQLIHLAEPLEAGDELYAILTN